MAMLIQESQHVGYKTFDMMMHIGL